MNMVAEALVALATLAAFLWFFYGPWQRTAEDLARQIIFERRAKLFSLALNGRLSFESDSYRLPQLMLNAYIRYAHDLSWPRLLFQQLFFKKKSRFSIHLDEAINDIDDDSTRAAVRLLVAESSAVLFYLIALKSVFLFPIGAAIRVLARPSIILFIDKEIEKGRPVTETLNQTMQASAAQEYEERPLLAA